MHSRQVVASFVFHLCVRAIVASIPTKIETVIGDKFPKNNSTTIQ
jgi:hypothetical protein